MFRCCAVPPQSTHRAFFNIMNGIRTFHRIRIKRHPGVFNANNHGAVFMRDGNFDPVLGVIPISVSNDVCEKFIQGKVDLE